MYIIVVGYISFIIIIISCLIFILYSLNYEIDCPSRATVDIYIYCYFFFYFFSKGGTSVSFLRKLQFSIFHSLI